MPRAQAENYVCWAPLSPPPGQAIWMGADSLAELSAALFVIGWRIYSQGIHTLRQASVYIAVFIIKCSVDVEYTKACDLNNIFDIRRVRVPLDRVAILRFKNRCSLLQRFYQIVHACSLSKRKSGNGVTFSSPSENKKKIPKLYIHVCMK